MGGVLDELIEYTEKHFSLEESTLTKHEFPECAAHHAEHRQTMLVEHIKKCDKKYSAYLRERGES